MIFSGTTEGRRLSERLASSGIAHDVCVATGYGERMSYDNKYANIHMGRLDKEGMERLIRERKCRLIVDATHPFAAEATRNIKAASEGCGVEYLRLKRDIKAGKSGNALYFSSHEECAGELDRVSGNILITTGIKNLAVYCEHIRDKRRIYARVLPSVESIEECERLGIAAEHVIAMQGPFSRELNEALIRQFDIKCIVTKQSGTAGGYEEKLMAAEETGAKAYVVEKNVQESGMSESVILKRIGAVCGKDFETRFDIVLAGVGMGDPENMLPEVARAVEDADIVFGAERLLSMVETDAKKYPYYESEPIISVLEGKREENAGDVKSVVLFSGDSGFYSGCGRLYAGLSEAADRLNVSISILPGISAVSYLASKTGVSYEDALILSMHGRECRNIAERIRYNKKIFLLTSGVGDVQKIAAAVCEGGMKDISFTIGYRLSYEDESVRTYGASEVGDVETDGLITCLIQNPKPERERVFARIKDDEFIRGNVPMTKEEIRTLTVSKLGLFKGATVYDIGAGTGSVAMQIAAASDDITVYAIEKNPEAVGLIEKNRRSFGIENIRIVEAAAPEGLSSLPAATHAFIGGSAGNLMEILRSLQSINGDMRVCVNAISLETISAIKDILKSFQTKNEDIVSVRIDRARKAGEHYLMGAENTVYIFSFQFSE